MVTVEKVRERALLVEIVRSRQARWQAEDALEELRLLVESAGADVTGTILQERKALDPRYGVGRGKAHEVKERCGQEGADLVVVDWDLSGSQQRNLEALWGCRVVDRAGVILDIFAQRARTREGKLQVELAQLDYLLPRLVGRGRLLSRLGGGIGTRGPGETELEYDRRQIRRRMAKIREDLHRVREHRARLRKPRERTGILTAALVGYTNAGKSTLLNTVTCSSVLVANKPFATLDPTLRRARLPSGGSVFLTDTVGFIRQLPPELVAAFKATLEEVVEADLLLHVIDASHPQVEEKKRVVEGILEEIGAGGKPMIEVYNKADRLEGAGVWTASGSGTPRVLLSALIGKGITDLLWEVERVVEEIRKGSPPC